MIGVALLASGMMPVAFAQSFNWQVAVNNGTNAPDGQTGATFRSYNQPAINDGGLMVFRARSSSGSGGSQTDGVYQFDSATPGAPVKLLSRGDAVPAPNNTDYTGVPAAFNEFPSTPRIDPNSPLIATRGQSQPVWTYMLGTTETRVGTSGIYAFPAGVPVTGASLLGDVVEADQFTLSFPQYSVPGALLGTRFDQFPGSPTVLDGHIVFKGNYTDPVDGLSRTGIYLRNVIAANTVPFTGLIANSNMRIPNQPVDGTTNFGSTAPPSGANGYIYFTGLDIEEAPTLGGIYRVHIATAAARPDTPVPPPLEVMVGIGDQVPGEAPGTYIGGLGEALSVSSDGDRVAFWASWGTDTFQKTLICPTDGNQDVIAYCNSLYPTGLVVDIPVNQGFFVHDAATGITTRIARTGEEGIEDFMFWNFSGRPPGVGGSVEPGTELARWRANTFAALSTVANGPSRIAFKAQRSGTSGIYLREGLSFQLPLVTVAEVGTTVGTSVDPAAPAGSLVSAVGIERDGFRNGRLALTVSMLYVDPLDPNTTASWGGIYLTDAPLEIVFRDGFE